MHQTSAEIISKILKRCTHKTFQATFHETFYIDCRIFGRLIVEKTQVCLSTNMIKLDNKNYLALNVINFGYLVLIFKLFSYKNKRIRVNQVLWIILKITKYSLNQFGIRDILAIQNKSNRRKKN